MGDKIDRKAQSAYEDSDKRRMKKRFQKTTESVCYMDELPDDILVDILSRLDVRMAGRMDAVSRRWRDLIYANPYNTIPMIAAFENEDSTSNSLILGFDRRNSTHHENIHALNNWMQSALSQRFQLPQSIVREFRLHNATLTALCLSEVALSSKNLDTLLLLFPNLETLSVQNNPEPLITRMGLFPRNDLKLKHLEFRYCIMYDMIIASLPNLVSFKLARKQTDLPRSIRFNPFGMPKLSCISLEGTYSGNTLSEIQRCCAALEQLELNMDLVREISKTPHLQSLRFDNVKQLKLVFDFYPESLMDMVVFISACPYLHKLTLMYGTREGCPFPRHTEPRYSHYTERWAKSYNHQCLQVVEFLGWCGCENEVRLANFLIKAAIHLEDLVFYPSTPQHRDRSGARTFDQSPRQADSVKKARACANRLFKKFMTIKASRG